MLESDIYTALTSYSALTDEVSTRIYPVELPDDASYPAIVYTNIGYMPENVLSQNNPECHARFQFDIWAKTYSECRTLLSILHSAIAAGLTGVFFSTFEDKEQNTRLYRISTDYSIWRTT